MVWLKRNLWDNTSLHLFSPLTEIWVIRQLHEQIKINLSKVHCLNEKSITNYTKEAPFNVISLMKSQIDSMITKAESTKYIRRIWDLVLLSRRTHQHHNDHIKRLWALNYQALHDFKLGFRRNRTVYLNQYKNMNTQCFIPFKKMYTNYFWIFYYLFNGKPYPRIPDSALLVF